MRFIACVLVFFLLSPPPSYGIDRSDTLAAHSELNGNIVELNGGGSFAPSSLPWTWALQAQSVFSDAKSKERLFTLLTLKRTASAPSLKDLSDLKPDILAEAYSVDRGTDHLQKQKSPKIPPGYQSHLKEAKTYIAQINEDMKYMLLFVFTDPKQKNMINTPSQKQHLDIDDQFLNEFQKKMEGLYALLETFVNDKQYGVLEILYPNMKGCFDTYENKVLPKLTELDLFEDQENQDTQSLKYMSILHSYIWTYYSIFMTSKDALFNINGNTQMLEQITQETSDRIQIKALIWASRLYRLQGYLRLFSLKGKNLENLAKDRDRVALRNAHTCFIKSLQYFLKAHRMRDIKKEKDIDAMNTNLLQNKNIPKRNLPLWLTNKLDTSIMNVTEPYEWAFDLIQKAPKGQRTQKLPFDITIENNQLIIQAYQMDPENDDDDDDTDEHLNTKEQKKTFSSVAQTTLRELQKKYHLPEPVVYKTPLPLFSFNHQISMFLDPSIWNYFAKEVDDAHKKLIVVSETCVTIQMLLWTQPKILEALQRGFEKNSTVTLNREAFVELISHALAFLWVDKNTLQDFDCMVDEYYSDAKKTFPIYQLFFSLLEASIDIHKDFHQDVQGAFKETFDFERFSNIGQQVAEIFSVIQDLNTTITTTQYLYTEA